MGSVTEPSQQREGHDYTGIWTGDGGMLPVIPFDTKGAD